MDTPRLLVGPDHPMLDPDAAIERCSAISHIERFATRRRRCRRHWLERCRYPSIGLVGNRADALILDASTLGR
jgi:hypothetical protein